MRRSRSRNRSPKHSKRRTNEGSSTAISSQRISKSGRMARRRCSTSASRRPWTFGRVGQVARVGLVGRLCHRRSRSTPHRRESFSVPQPTWRPSRRAGRASTSERTSGHLVASCMRCSRAAQRFRTHSHRYARRYLRAPAGLVGPAARDTAARGSAAATMSGERRPPAVARHRRCELDLEDDADLLPLDAVAARARKRRAWTTAAAWTLAAVATGAAIWAFSRGKPTATGGPLRFTISPASGEELPIDAGLPPPVAISRDGRSIAYVTRRAAGNRIYLRRREDVDGKPIAGTEGGMGPFFSPDGQWIGFASSGFLRKVPVQGGTPQNSASVSNMLR